MVTRVVIKVSGGKRTNPEELPGSKTKPPISSKGYQQIPGNPGYNYFAGYSLGTAPSQGGATLFPFYSHRNHRSPEKFFRVNNLGFRVILRITWTPNSTALLPEVRKTHLRSLKPTILIISFAAISVMGLAYI